MATSWNRSKARPKASTSVHGLIASFNYRSKKKVNFLHAISKKVDYKMSFTSVIRRPVEESSNSGATEPPRLPAYFTSSIASFHNPHGIGNIIEVFTETQTIFIIRFEMTGLNKLSFYIKLETE